MSTTTPHPTPTGNPLFAYPTKSLLNASPTASGGQVRPTVASYFVENPVDTPLPAEGEEEADPNDDGTVRIPDDVEIETITIYDDQLNDGWRIFQSSVMNVDLNHSEYVFDGTSAVEITPGRDYDPVYFAVQSNNDQPYLRDQVLGVKFRLSGGSAPIEQDDLAITVIGSNQYQYYVPGDTSVTNIYEPVFSETRLYYLNINRMIPVNTWVSIEVILDDLIFDPIYKYVTGFYIKNDEGFLNSYYIDNVQIDILEDTEEVEVEPTPTLSLESTELEPAVAVKIDADNQSHTISPMVYGISVAPAEVVEALRPGINSWGGNPNTRYNWEIGNAWNSGRDYFYINGNYDHEPGNVADRFIEATTDAGAEVRLSVPTLGWVAKNDDNSTCSFPMADGSCGDADGASCSEPGEIADPRLANVPTDTDFVLEWLRHIYNTMNFDVRILAMDNEPELWGVTHYDVHPECTTYQEILDMYIEYAAAIRQEFPDVELAGPVTCCWHYYWNSAAGRLDKLLHGNQDFLPWFLDQVRAYDTDNQIRTIDVLDIHYYPEDLYNQDIAPDTSARRLRATRSLWDPTYVDESWIDEPVYLIPRMQELIDEHYPGLELGISEWNFGGWGSMNAALATAEVLGIMGREDVYYANYYGYPKLETPEFFAFKMFTNYDDKGGKFGDTAVFAESDDPDQVSAFAAIDTDTGNLHIILINKNPDELLGVGVVISGFGDPSAGTLYRYSEDNVDAITSKKLDWETQEDTIELPPYSINHLVLEP